MPRNPNTPLTYLLCSLLVVTSLQSSITWAAASDLPKLGDTISSVVSPETEELAGKAWLRALRARAPIISDPLLNDYLESLIYRLAANSELEQPDLTTIIINSTAINAFAVPGGIIGVNAGLFLNAEREAEFAAVMAHELAHLSQRHFARAVERQKKTQWATLAAMLASVAIIAATGGGDPGLAALATTQAAAIQSQLRFSRDNEREADRLGMDTLVGAGFDPNAMPVFFEKLQDQYKYYALPPEFLLTHPVTQNRVADSRNRAAQIQKPRFRRDENLEYQLMRARTLVAYTKDAKTAVEQYQAALGSSEKAGDGIDAAARYGLVRALLKAEQYEKALEQARKLRETDRNRITYVVAEAEVLFEMDRYNEAKSLLSKHLEFNPKNYPLTVYYVQALLRSDDAKKAIPLLERQLLDQEENPYLWQLLSQAYGDAGNRVGVHRAKAEVKFLHNQADEAIAQLEYALPLAKQNFQLTSKIQSRIEEIKVLKREVRI